MIIKWLWLFFLAVLLNGCATKIDSYRVISPVQAVEYNSISSQYEYRPTFADIVQFANGESMLVFSVSYFNPFANSINGFALTQLPEYFAVLEKFKRWVEVANRDGDMLDKPIHKFSEPLPHYGGMYVEAKFYSGAIGLHYLTFTACTSGLVTQICNEPLAFRAEDTDLLENFLYDFAQGNLNKPDESKYN